MRRMLLAVTVLALVAAGCGKDIETGTPEPAGSLDATPSQAASGEILHSQPANCKVVASKDTKKKPEITVPSCTPSTTLIAEDLVVGTGAELKGGENATIQYVGISWSTKKQFDASWDRGQPFTTTIPGQLIAGWNEGIPGMKVGGRRILIIPPDKGYGPQGSPPDIGPNETLVFVVDLVALQK